MLALFMTRLTMAIIAALIISLFLTLSRGSVRLDPLDLYAQQHILLESILLAIVHAKVGAVEGAAGICTADLLLEHGVLKAFEGINGERHGLRDAVKRQFT